MINKIKYDALIIGGSYAGLSAAMALGRSIRQVLIIDSGQPCNKQTPYSHNFITQDGETPHAIREKALEQVLKYDTVTLLNGLAVDGKKTEEGFAITTETGEEFQTKKLIFATGIKDLIPDIKGFAACWGISVVHCPYCHGYELRNQKTGIIANGERASHLASLVNNLSDNITILTGGKADFNEEQFLKLNQNEIQIIEKEISEIEHEAGVIKYVLFKDQTRMDFEAAYASIPFKQHTDLPVKLGCELTELGHLKVDHLQKTNVKGIYACGDNTSPMRSVANAVASGNLTGAVVNSELTVERF